MCLAGAKPGIAAPDARNACATALSAPQSAPQTAGRRALFARLAQSVMLPPQETGGVMRFKILASIAAFATLGLAPAGAQEVTLRAVTSFAEGTQFSKNFERFIEKVNADGKGVVKINYIGERRD